MSGLPNADADVAAVRHHNMDPGRSYSSILAEASEPSDRVSDSDVSSDNLGEGRSDGAGAEEQAVNTLRSSLINSNFTGGGAFEEHLAHIVEDARESETGSTTEDGSSAAAFAEDARVDATAMASAAEQGADNAVANGNDERKPPAILDKSKDSPSAASHEDEGAGTPPVPADKEEVAKEPVQPAFKFQYEPLDFEKDYYASLFRYAKGNDEGDILPPKAAAELFLASGIPWDRLRMMWNMAVMPVEPYPPGTKPPPAMTFGQFQSAVRLIQLFQNRITAKDEKLRVEKGVMMAPAFFAGVSGVVVPLPWNESGQEDGVTQRRPRRRHSGSKLSNSLTRQMDSLSVFYSTAEEKKGSPPGGRDSTTMVQYDAEDDYFMSHAELLTYQETFSRHCVTEANGPETEQNVYVDEAVQLFTKSGLDRDTLGRLWDVVVTDPDSGKLDEEAFVLMTHLIVCVTRRGLAVPTELPSPLRIWRKNRFGGQGESQDKDEAEAESGAHHNKFVPIQPSDDEGQRMKRMEGEIWSLKQTVDSLRLEVQELRNIIHATQPPQYDPTPNDDVPNVDVEWYHRETEEGDDDEDGTFQPSDTFQHSNASLGIRKPKASAAPPGPNQPPQLTAKRSSPPTRTTNRGMSQNIPAIHPGARKIQSMYRSMPQGRAGQGSPPATNARSKAAQSMTTGTNDNLASQMQQVEREETFDALMQTTMERFSEAGSVTGSHVGSLASSRYNPRASFRPAQLNRNTVPRPTGRRGNVKRSLVESARHITRGISGKTEIYETVESPSTAAVDVPPL
ncbi:hypothetical protein ACHAXT_005758 [Thalassiosira profunda]